MKDFVLSYPALIGIFLLIALVLFFGGLILDERINPFGDPDDEEDARFGDERF